MSKKKFAKKLGIAAVTLAAAQGISYAVTKCLMNIAMDRKEPKTVTSTAQKYIKKDRELNPFFAHAEEKAAELEQISGERVEIIADDGVNLAGHWYPHENPKRILIAMHGWRSTWSHNYGMISEFWFQNGCSVLFPEQRGHSNSGGDYIGFGMLERYDCRKWIDWVEEHNEDNLPIYLCGVSMGASTVLMTSGFDLPDNVHGIVADCGFTSPKAIWKHVAEKGLHISYNLRDSVANSICRNKIQMGNQDYSTLDALETNTKPVLFIHGSSDDFVPIEMTYENFRKCKAEKRLMVVPGASHSMSYYMDKERYEMELLRFWQDYDVLPVNTDKAEECN